MDDIPLSGVMIDLGLRVTVSLSSNPVLQSFLLLMHCVSKIQNKYDKLASYNIHNVSVSNKGS